MPGRLVHVYAANDKTFGPICDAIRPEKLMLGELRAEDLTPLRGLAELNELHLNWAPKVLDLAPLTALEGLRLLTIRDCTKLRDLEPLGTLTQLRELEICGSFAVDMKVESLVPLGRLDRLERLIMTCLKVADPEGLRPLAGCTGLSYLHVPYNFPVEHYPYLMAHLPETDCAAFAPYVKVLSPYKGKDIMVVGKRRPFLNSTKDAARIRKYVEAFEALLHACREEAKGRG